MLVPVARRDNVQEFQLNQQLDRLIGQATAPHTGGLRVCRHGVHSPWYLGLGQWGILSLLAAGGCGALPDWFLTT